MAIPSWQNIRPVKPAQCQCKRHTCEEMHGQVVQSTRECAGQGNRQIRKRTPNGGTQKESTPASPKLGSPGGNFHNRRSELEQIELNMTRLRKFSSHPKFDKERRKHLLAGITMSNEGKKHHFLFILPMIVLFCSTFASSPSTLRGGG